MTRPKYLRLAAEIEQAITDGSLPAGARLPSIRELMAQKAVSLSTVTAALRRLEEAGLVEPRAKSGFFVRRLRESTPGPEAGHDIDRHEVGTPSSDLYPAERLKRLMASVVRRNPQLPARPPRRAVSARLARAIARRSAEVGCFLKPAELVLTQGDIEAASLALRACAAAGDAILAQRPLDPGLERVLESLEMEAIGLPVSEPIPDAVERALARESPVKAIFVNTNFHLPTGQLLSIPEKRRLLRLCLRAGLPIIEDDRFGDLQHHGPRPLPLKSFDTEGSVIYLSSCCRSIAPGLQIGWLAASSPWLGRIEALKNASSSGVSELSQLVLTEFLERGSHFPHLRKLREQLGARAGVIRQLLRARLGVPLTSEGAYNHWLPAVSQPDAERTAAWMQRWPGLFSDTAPVLRFLDSGLYVNSSFALDESQLDALAECCEEIGPFFRQGDAPAAPVSPD